MDATPLHGIFRMAFFGPPPADGQPRKQSVACCGSFDGSLADIMLAQGPSDLAPWWDKENWFYSVACAKPEFFKGSGRKGKTGSDDWAWQEWIPFDVDKVDLGIWTEEEAVALIEEVLPKDGQRFYVWTGHGIQCLYRVKPFGDVRVFDAFKAAYDDLCRQLEIHLNSQGVKVYEVDRRMWEPARMMRIPNTWNQKYESDGSPKPRKRSFLIGAYGNGESAKLRQILMDYVPQAATADAVKGGANAIARVVALFDQTRVQEFPRYFRVMCPFHKSGEESEPSLALYKDNWGYAIDMHCTKGEPGYAVPLFHVWLAVKYPEADRSGLPRDHPRYGEFCKFIGIDSPPEAAVLLIKDWIVECLVPMFRCDGTSFWSKVEHKAIKISDIRYKYGVVIRDRLQQNSQEAKTQDGLLNLRDVYKLFRDQSGAAFDSILRGLPTIGEIAPKEVPGRARKDILKMLRAAFNSAVPHTIEGQHKRISLLGLAKEVPWDDATWMKAEQYEFFYRRFGGKWQAGFKFQLLHDLPATRAWADEFDNAKQFVNLAVELGLCKRDRLRVGRVQHRVLLLTDDAMETVDFGDDIEPDTGIAAPTEEEVFSNRIQKLLNSNEV